MRRKIILTIFLSLVQFFASAQISISGTIIDKATRLPVEYANIGLLEKGIGTVCNTLGKFELLVPGGLINNTLTISHLGYETSTLQISVIKNNPTALTIELVPVAIRLQEITIEASQQVNLGYKPDGSKVTGFFKAAGLGLEGGTLIGNKGQVSLTQFNFHILKIPFDSLKFRLNFYAVKKNNPTDKINLKDIIFTLSKADTGIYSLPLNEENILVKGNFICTIELIELFGKNAENAEFLFSAIPDKEGFIYKKTISLGGWKRIKKYSLCFWLKGNN